MDIPLSGLVPFAEEEPVVRTEDDDGVGHHAVGGVAVVVRVIEGREDAADLHVHPVDQAVDFLDVRLEEILGAKARAPAAGTFPALKNRGCSIELGLRIGLGMGDRIALVERVIGRIRLIGVGIQHVRRLPTDLQAERGGGGVFRRVCRVSDELDGEVADEFCDVAAVGGFSVDHLVEVGSLTVPPLVEVIGPVETCESIAEPMLADETEVVAGIVEPGRIGIRPLRGGEVLVEGRDAVARLVLPHEDAGATHHANRGGGEGILEDRPL